MSQSARVKRKPLPPLNDLQLGILRAVISDGPKSLSNLAARPLQRRKLVFISWSCAHGCCTWFKATPAGYKLAGKRVPKGWR